MFHESGLEEKLSGDGGRFFLEEADGHGGRCSMRSESSMQCDGHGGSLSLQNKVILEVDMLGKQIWDSEVHRSELEFVHVHRSESEVVHRSEDVDSIGSDCVRRSPHEVHDVGDSVVQQVPRNVQ